MQNRIYEFNVGITASTQPDAGTPTLTNDLVTKGYVDAAFVTVPSITGSTGAPSSIIAGTGIAFAGTSSQYFHMWFVQGSGGAVDISASPQIAVGTAVGQRLMVIGCSDVNTVKLEHGTGLILNGECFLANGSMIELLWNGASWNEISRNMV